MNSQSFNFVGRETSIKNLKNALTGHSKSSGRLTIQSIEGPGGIGKTYLFNHVMATTDLTSKNYLTLQIDGNDLSEHSLDGAIVRLIDNIESIQDRPARDSFPKTFNVVKAIETIKSEAIHEIKNNEHSSDQEIHVALTRYIDLAIASGKKINEVLPKTQQIIDIKELEKVWDSLEQLIPKMRSFNHENGWFNRSSKELRNSIRENASRVFTDALVEDLSEIIAHNQSKKQNKFVSSKRKPIDGILLIFDDYEKLQNTLGEFLVNDFLRTLGKANFESVVVILGRDQLVVTHPGWDQHFKSRLLDSISLTAFTQEMMDQFVEFHNIRSQREKDRAWQDTQGFPFYVQLWVEEVKSGGRSAVMIKRIYDRTTRWMTNKQKEWLEPTLFLDEVNERTLRKILNDPEDAEAAFQWFKDEGSLRDTKSAEFRVWEFLRSRLVDYIRISDPDRYEELECKAASAPQRVMSLPTMNSIAPRIRLKA